MKKYKVFYRQATFGAEARGFIWVDNGVIVRLERNETVPMSTGFTDAYVGENVKSLPRFYKCVEIVEPSIGDAIERLSSYRDRVLEDCKRISEEMATRATYDSFMTLHLLQGKINGLDLAIITLKFFEGKEKYVEMSGM